MSFRFTSDAPIVNAIGIPVAQGAVRITEDGRIRVTQTTGNAVGSLNQEPGTDPTVPDAAGGNDPGVPLGFIEIPKTGPLT